MVFVNMLYPLSGLQAEARLHHCPGTNGEYMQRLLEDGDGQKVWCYHHALQLAGEWESKSVNN